MINRKELLKDKESLISNLVGVIIAIVGGIGTVIGVYYAQTRSSTKNSKQLSYETRVVQDKIQHIEKDLHSALLRLESLESIKGATTTPLTVEVVKMNKSLEDAKNRLSDIEKIIIQDPVKSLEIPFLKKDLETSREKNISDIENIREDIDKIYSLILGSIITLIIAILTPLIQNIMTYRRELKSKTDGKKNEN